MLTPSGFSPLRNEAVDFIHSEITRVGLDKLDRSAIVRAFVAKGASRARVFAWIKDELELIRNPPEPGPDPIAVEVARAEAMIAAEQRAAVLNSIPSKTALLELEREANATIRASRRDVPALICPVAESPESGGNPPPTVDETGLPVDGPSASGVGAVMARLERATETVEKCITYSFGDNGKVRNPRMALASADALRKCLETALKLHETVDNVQAVQRFMAEIMAELRDVAPEVAAAVVERLRGVTARWAK